MSVCGGRASPKTDKKTAMEPLTFGLFKKLTIRDKFSSVPPEDQQPDASESHLIDMSRFYHLI
jgi:hypothetical protein